MRSDKRQPMIETVLAERMSKLLHEPDKVDGLSDETRAELRRDIREIRETTARCYHAAIDELVLPELCEAVRGDPELARHWHWDINRVVQAVLQARHGPAELDVERDGKRYAVYRERLPHTELSAARATLVKILGREFEGSGLNPDVTERELAQWVGERIADKPQIRVCGLAEKHRADLVAAVTARRYSFGGHGELEWTDNDGHKISVSGANLYELFFSERALIDVPDTYPQPASETQAVLMRGLRKFQNKPRTKTDFDELARTPGPEALRLLQEPLKVQLIHSGMRESVQLLLPSKHIVPDVVEQLMVLSGKDKRLRQHAARALGPRLLCGTYAHVWQHGEHNSAYLAVDDFLRNTLGMSAAQVRKPQVRQAVVDWFEFWGKLQLLIGPEDRNYQRPTLEDELNFMTLEGKRWARHPDGKREVVGFYLHINKWLYGYVRPLKGGPQSLAFYHVGTSLPQASHRDFPYVHQLGLSLPSMLRSRYSATGEPWLEKPGRTWARIAGYRADKRTLSRFWGPGGQWEKTIAKLQETAVVARVEWTQGRQGPDGLCRLYQSRPALAALQGVAPRQPQPTRIIHTGADLRAALAASGLSQQKFAEAYGVSRGSIARGLRKGDKPLPAQLRAKLNRTQ